MCFEEDKKILAQKKSNLLNELAKKIEEDRSASFYKDGNFVWFGFWPQSKKAEGVKISGNKDQNGYLLGGDGNRYAQVDCSFYKVEPIKWRVLEEKNGRALILCERPIEGLPFDKSCNNYAKSGVRVWLNGEFLAVAFGPAARDRIVAAVVDNGAAGTGKSVNKYACADTEDRVFLPSRGEAVKKFRTDGEPTDYAIAKSAGGVRWLRSPYFYDQSRACAAEGGGFVWLPVQKICGIAPAMWVKL